MNALLERLVREAAAETEERRRQRPLQEVELMVSTAAPVRDFRAALARPGLSLVAEAKSRTPLKGSLANDYDPAQLVALYEAAGADALSVLCQAASFGGSPDHLASARSASSLPLMRKDFVTDEYQVLEARALGADAILLILAVLERARLTALLGCASQVGLSALVEVHTEEEVLTALDCGADIIGVNHRDLDTFDVDTSLTERLRPLVPATCLVVAESGIRSGADAAKVRAAGADAILVGEALMLAPDPMLKIRELRAA